MLKGGNMDFSKVTALQIPEGNVTKIEDKEGKVLWDNVNKYAYGVRWDSVNQATTACERIGNLELHKTLPIQSRFKVCIHKGKEIQYYCNPNDSRFVDFDNDNNKDEINDVVFNINDRDVLGNIFWFGNNSLGATSLDDESTNNYYMLVTDARFLDYRWLYAYVKITASDKNIYIGRIIKIDVSTKQATIELSQNLDNVQPFTNIELGCSINGYDGEIGVDTGGKFYQWSVDNDGAGNEVWQSLYKCVSYAREIKRHIIGIDRACVLNVAFNDPKWGWIGSLEANTAVNVINYHTNLRGGANTTNFDKYLGIDSFRCQLGKARTKLPLATMRSYSQKTDGGQMLYKQIWEAIVWSYVIEYADFDAKKAYKSELTTEGYHQGGLGNGVTGGRDLANYNSNQKFTPNDYTLALGNNTAIKVRAARQYGIPVAANHYWDNYTTNSNDILLALDGSYKVLTIMGVVNPNTDYNIKASGDVVGGTVKYKITGLAGGQTIVFKREKGNLTVTTDGTYDVEWGTSNVERKIYFNEFQSSCNIVIEILSAPSYNIIQGNQIAWNVPHWRGFNVFWYGDTYISVDNMLSKYDTTKQKRILYYTDDITKFSDDISNKEHQIEGFTKIDNEDWLREIRINNKGDIFPVKNTNTAAYKHAVNMSNKNTDVVATYIGGSNAIININNIFSFYLEYLPAASYTETGFVKVTILDD
nr:MAG: hypothetical protein [Bacteriophage sp.]